MEKLTDLLAMGEYAAYVWPSFFVTALIMGFLTFSSLRALKHAKKVLAGLQEPHES